MMKRLSRALCVCALALLLSGAALAAGQPLPVSQSASNGAKTAAVTYTLTAADPGAPMPQGARDGVFSFTMTGSAQSTIPAIEPDRPGVWRYTLSAESKTASVTPSTVTLEVTAVEAGQELRVTVLAKLPSGEKTELQFQLTKGATPVTPQPTTPPRGSTPKTGDDRPLLLIHTVFALSLALMVLASAQLRRDRK